MVPSAADANTFWEHILRYRFAAQFAAGKRVLDIACGEGYGSAGLVAAGAASVIGVDVSPEACEHARTCYKIDARVGTAEAIPIPDTSVDVVVSFETIEHLQQPVIFIKECHRVLAPGGALIISTPNLTVYKQRTPNNPFHQHEMTLEEFETSLGECFQNTAMYGQLLPPPQLSRIRGVGRLRRLWMRLVAPHTLREPSAWLRANAVDLIVKKPSWRDGFDPFQVRRMGRSDLLESCYLVAVTSKSWSANASALGS
jgi:SAM-dependent methyltransferase